MKDVGAIITIVGVALWIFSYIYFSFWQHLAENTSFNLRQKYIEALLR